MPWDTQPDPIDGFSSPTGTATFLFSEWGGIPDETTDNSDALLALLDRCTAAGGGEIIFDRIGIGGTYLFESAPPSDRFANNLIFRGRGMPTLVKAFDGDWFYSTTGGASQSKWLDLRVDLQGDEYSGSFIRFGTNTHSQEVAGCILLDGADSIFLFEDIGGSLCHIHHNITNIHLDNVLTGAVVKRTVTAVDTQAPPRFFDHNYGLTHSFFVDADGFQGAYFDHIYSAGMNLGDNSLGCTLNNCRMAIPVDRDVHISGNSTMVTMCEIGSGSLFIDAGFVYGHFVNNIQDPSGTFTDNSIKTGLATQPIVENPQLAVGTQAIIMATADLPAASAGMNGRIVIEDAGAGNRNLIIYAGGQRFRVDGGANF